MNLAVPSDDLDREVNDLLPVPGQGRIPRSLCTISEDEEDVEESKADGGCVELRLPGPVKANPRNGSTCEDKLLLGVPFRFKHSERVDQHTCIDEGVASHARQNETKSNEPDVIFKPIVQPQETTCNSWKSRQEAWYQSNGEKLVDGVLQELLPYNPMPINRHRKSIPTIVLEAVEENLIDGDDTSGCILSSLPDGTEIYQEPDITDVIQIEGRSVILIKKKRKLKVKLPVPKIPLPRSRSPARGILSVTKSIFGFSDSDTEDKDSDSNVSLIGGARRRLSMLPPMVQSKAPPVATAESAKTRYNRRSMSWSVGNVSADNLKQLRRISAGTANNSDDTPPRMRPDPFDDLLKVKQDKRLYLSERDRKFIMAVPYIRAFVIGVIVGCLLAVLCSIIALIIPWEDPKSV
jgi:hypothetical protein